ncbi:hypothetical protein KIK06_18495 [Nocardiopsis sp. EMB25]|uniref:hypothetical protein n=1 Tax=Nocardiopsis sp. EMB25 TaxID=2835867 RepID=UPI00228500BA|nr:hypothetical protein [Nocardiopsis sp. EMB25]MCY9785883.1 hypothetical protein [Nocardiopsis sp. EMB25]
MSQPEPRQNGRGSVQAVPPSFVEAAAGNPEYDSTARLCAAAWTDRYFRDAVLRECADRPHRTPAREPGLDAGRVVRECLRARNVRAAAGACFLGFALVLCLFNVAAVLVVLTLAVALEAWARYRRNRDLRHMLMTLGGRGLPGLSRPNYLPWVIGVIALLFLPMLFGGLLVGLGTDYSGSFDGSPQPAAGPGVGSLIPFWFGLLILFTAAVLSGYAVRNATNTALRSIRKDAGAPWRGSGVGTVPVAFYTGAMPFVGAGLRFDSWPVLLKLLPGQEDRPTRRGNGQRPGPGADQPAGGLVAAGSGTDGEPARKEPTLTGGALVERLYAELREQLPKLSGTEGEHSSTRREVELADCVFLPGVRQDRVEDLVPNMIAADGERGTLRREWVSGFVNVFHERARHFLEIGISTWESQVVVTAFVRLSTQGGLLHVEGETMVMPPVDDEHRMPAGALPTGTDPGDTVALVVESARNVLPQLRSNLTESRSWLRSWSAVRRNNREHTWARKNDEFFDYAPSFGIRQLGAAPQIEQLFQEHDLHRITRAIPEKVLICVRDVLQEAGYDTEQVAKIIQNISNDYGNHFHGDTNFSGNPVFQSGKNNQNTSSDSGTEKAG